MLDSADAHQWTDKRVAAALSRRSGSRLNVSSPPRFTRSGDAARQLRRWMESDGRVGEIREGAVEELGPVFFYVCRTGQGEPSAQGIGATPELAICDAFLHCGTETNQA